MKTKKEVKNKLYNCDKFSYMKEALKIKVKKLKPVNVYITNRVENVEITISNKNGEIIKKVKFVELISNDRLSIVL